jgi:hypothetical protein
MGPGGAQGANAGGEVDTSFLDDFLNDNDFSNAINISNNNNNNNANVSTSNQNMNNEQTSRHHRNNKSKFDIYLPNI